MEFQHKPNSGSLFKNDKREKETHAHARGDALIDGVEYWVNAWTNTRNNGEKYQSLKFSRKDQNRAPNPNPVFLKTDAEDFDDDIPF